ncbi:hypothetical protein [Streptomyces lanatus]|uniref:Uncharacterized protein n=1 Tax=Streptomyces lanatus TaxID=66900 RepID=A0ABV1Y7F2_9ACTN|nr:hypothetical protein [Streptomyces lanatus]
MRQVRGVSALDMARCGRSWSVFCSCWASPLGGEGAHAATEYVELGSLDRLTDVLAATITDFCS